MCRFLNSVQDRLAPLKHFVDCTLSPLVFLALRITVAKAFFISGWLKFGYVLNNQLDTLYFLFEDYKVPFLPVKVAAWMGMSGVIYHTDGNPLAAYWALICATIAVHGAGKYSLDTLIWCRKKSETP
jgi:uncharacterized membrane protein YphA (DoxX/SURF4 family)